MNPTKEKTDELKKLKANLEEGPCGFLLIVSLFCVFVLFCWVLSKLGEIFRDSGE
jgi:hypothetical protein